MSTSAEGQDQAPARGEEELEELEATSEDDAGERERELQECAECRSREPLIYWVGFREGWFAALNMVTAAITAGAIRDGDHDGACEDGFTQLEFLKRWMSEGMNGDPPSMP